MSVLAVAAALAALAGGPTQVVHPDGRVGQFRIDVTTRAQVLAALGKPRTTMVAVSESSGKRIGVRLAYACGAGCDTVYSFSDETGRLSDFASASRSFRTEHGSAAGMSSARAAKLEGNPVVPGCGSGKSIHVRWDETHQFALAVLGGRVTILAYIGPHSTYDEPFC
jgi:hypothetical protein